MIQKTQSRTIIGLMSGTSYDGVDAVLVKIGAENIKLIHHTHTSYPPTLRQRIASVFDGKVSDICKLNFELGELFAKAALVCAKEAGIAIGEVDAVASHGQTICHIPPEKNRKGSTMQIAESAIIAQRTGLKVVSDFRAADMAQGGEGAPLVPFADYRIFKDRATCAVHNLGGISNVTVVTPEIEDLMAFDTGPGNCLIDDAMTTLFGRPLDRGGKVAAKGKPDAELLDMLMGHPFFSKKPPKSTGRESFGKELLLAVLDRQKRVRPEDIVATLTHLTACSIKQAYDLHILNKHWLDEIILTGGGTKNKYLVELITEMFSPIKVTLIDELGIPAQAKEAMSFTVLANETLEGRPSNLPQATGAARPVVLGKITTP